MPKEKAVKRMRRRPKQKSSDVNQRIVVQTDDGYTFFCDVEALRVSGLLRGAIDSGGKDKHPLRIPGITHDIVQRVLWWMDNHREDQDLKEGDFIDEKMDAWQRCFLSTTIDIILKLISAANYLNVRRLQVLGINKLAEIINEKLSEDNPIRAVRDAFHIRAPEPSIFFNFMD